MASLVTLADALAAIRQRLSDNWTTTQIAFENIDPAPADGIWPPVDPVSQAPVPWVYCEMFDTGLDGGFGKPGSRNLIEHGMIKLYVMVQKGSGTADAYTKAVALGEIFRDQEFFKSDPTAMVRTRTPRVGQDPLVSADGNCVAGACCSIPYEFWHQA
jgi:hypothetical protein